MSIYADVNGKKKISNIFANVAGAKKEITSVWVNKDGVPTKVFAKGGAGKRIFVFATYLTKAASNVLCYSYDLVTFNYCKGLPSSIIIKTLTFTNDRFFVITNKGLYYSLDGVTFQQTSLTTTLYTGPIYYENGIYYLQSSTAYESTDGVNFEVKTYNGVGSYGNKIIKFKNKYFAVKSSGDSAINWSNDLQTWNRNYNVKYSGQGYAVTEDRLTFYYGQNSTTVYAYSTTDGVNFEQKQINTNAITISTLKNIYSAIYANGYVWIIGDNGNNFKYNYKSIDGWTNFERVGADNYSLNGGSNTRLEYVDEKYVTIYGTGYGKIYTSADFIDWEQHTIYINNTSFNISDFVYNEVANE